MDIIEITKIKTMVNIIVNDYVRIENNHFYCNRSINCSECDVRNACDNVFMRKPSDEEITYMRANYPELWI